MWCGVNENLVRLACTDVRTQQQGNSRPVFLVCERKLPPEISLARTAQKGKFTQRSEREEERSITHF